MVHDILFFFQKKEIVSICFFYVFIGFCKTQRVPKDLRMNNAG